MGSKNKQNFSELRERISMARIHYVDDGYGGLKREIFEGESFWAAVVFVSAKDVLSRSIKDLMVQKGVLRKPIYQVIVRQETKVSPGYELTWKGRTLKPLSALISCEGQRGYAHFHAVEIKGGE